jgi:hypothetical protein
MRFKRKAIFGWMSTAAILLAGLIPIQAAETGGSDVPVRFGRVVPLSRYVRLVSGNRTIHPDSSAALRYRDVRELKVVFLRDSLNVKDGPQYLKITTVSTDVNGRILDDDTQYAITFSRLADAESDRAQLERFVDQVNPMGFYNPELIEVVPIQVDSLGPWGHVHVRVEPENELVKYYGRVRNRLEYSIRVRGGRFQTAFTLSVPKVLYDTCDDDSVSYGKTSAMLRINALRGGTGEPFPVSVGVGTFGMDSPIDVSRKGGGFAISLYFDVIQMLRILDMKLPPRVNAGFDVSPFFPIDHKARILFSARLGINS